MNSLNKYCLFYEDILMRTLDLSPLYRSVIGFDRMARMLDSADQADSGYPPYDIEAISENEYRITVAIAGFKRDELVISQENNQLKVSGKKAVIPEADAKQYLHQGIARRNFERRFQLADHVEVTGAEYADGLLQVNLIREIPETMKPRTIQISQPTLQVEN